MIMMTVKILNLGWQATLLRYFLMMAFVIGGVLSGLWPIAFLGLPLFLSAILGIQIERKKRPISAATVKRMQQTDRKTLKAG